MLDPKLLRRDLDSVKASLLKRNFVFDEATFSQLESSRQTLQQTTQDLQSVRNQKSKLIGQAKSRGEDASELLKEMEQLSSELKLKSG